MQQSIPILGPHSVERSINVNNQQTINLRVAPQQPGAKSPLALYHLAGLNTKNTAGNGACRTPKLVEFGGLSYGVFGNKFCSIDESFITAEIGTLNTSSGKCVVVAGRDYIVVVDGTDGWHYNGTTFTQITDGDFPSNCTHIAYIDGYFLGNNSSSDEWRISSSEDPTAWAAVDAANAESRPDNITCIINTKAQVYLIGPTTNEVWANTGNADFPFQRYPGGILEYGIRAPYSAARSAKGIVYYSHTEEGGTHIVIVNATQSQVISTDSLSDEIKDFSDDTDAYGLCYSQAGKTYYQITFPTADRTYLVDLDTGNWSRLKSLNIGRHRMAGHGYLNGKHICGDYSNNNIYELDEAYYKDGDDLIDKERVTQVIHKDRRRLLISLIQIEVEAGTTASPTDDPQLLLRYSKNGGKTWSNWVSRSIGKQGEYGQLVNYRMGILGRDIVLHFKSSADCKFNVIGGYADIEVLNG